MLESVIKFGKKVKEVRTSDINNINLGATISKESGNIRVDNFFYINIGISAKKFKDKVVVYIEDHYNEDGGIYIDGNAVNKEKLVTHLKNIGLVGLSDKLNNTINSLDRCTDEDIVQAVENSDNLKFILKDFIVHSRLTIEEKEEFENSK